jgi:GNAT superfamily N-acetyltransferase
MTFTLRNALSDEAEALARLQEASAVEGFSNVFPPGRYPFPRDEVLASWRELLEREDVVALVAEDGAELLGFAVLRPEWLERLYTHPNAWGRGVGSRLHDEGSSSSAASARRGAASGCSRRTSGRARSTSTGGGG